MTVAEAVRALLGTSAFRLAILYVTAFVLAATLIAGTLFVQMNALTARQSLDIVAAELEGLVELNQSGSAGQLAETITDRSRHAGSSLYLLVDAQGARIAGNLNRWPPELAEKPAGGLFHYETGASAGPRGRLAVAIPALLAGGRRLLVGRDLEEQRSFIDRAKWLLIAGIGMLALMGIAGGMLASRVMLGRVERINYVARTIMDGNLSQRVPVAGEGDEIDALAINLNAMLERIESLMIGLREVSDNIAHDLKTPLTRLRSRVEAALRASDDPAAHREGLERTIEDADELIKTFNALLLIARLEARAVEASLEDIDLGELVEGAVELYEPLAEERGMKITCEAQPSIRVRANRQLIGQAVANLIDNALKYAASAEEASVTVTAAMRDGRPEISVADRGPGIAPEDRERARRRFVRLETSRTAPGTGLGLSLVAAVARLHGGEMRLEDNRPGLKVVLALPGQTAPVSPRNS